LESKAEQEKLEVLELEKQKIEDEKNIPLWQELIF